MRLTYDKIVLNGTDTFGTGSNNVCVSKNAIAANNYPVVTVKRC